MLLIDSQVEITTKIRNFVPEDTVDLICCFIPKIINKRTKKSCKTIVLKKRHKKAKELHNMLQEYYIDDIDEYDIRKIDHFYKPIDLEDVALSALPERLPRTLETISEILLSDKGNWCPLFVSDWRFFDNLYCRNVKYRSFRELAFHNHAVFSSYRRGLLMMLMTNKRYNLINLII